MLPARGTAHKITSKALFSELQNGVESSTLNMLERVRPLVALNDENIVKIIIANG